MSRHRICGRPGRLLSAWLPKSYSTFGGYKGGDQAGGCDAGVREDIGGDMIAEEQLIHGSLVLAARTLPPRWGGTVEALVLSDRPGPFQVQIPYYYISFPH